MADYPGTTFTPTTKTTGDTIAASHVNALQAEVTAIEAALLTTGLAHALTITGLLTVAVVGTHAFGAAGTGTSNTVLKVIGHNGASSGSAIDFYRNVTQVGLVGSLATIIGGGSTSNAVALYGAHADGVRIHAGNAAGAIEFYTQSARRMNLSATGVLTLDAYTAATFVAGDKYLVVDASGNVHVSAVGPAS